MNRFNEPIDDQDWFDIGADLRIKIRTQFSQLNKRYQKAIEALKTISMDSEDNGTRSMSEREMDQFIANQTLLELGEL